MNTKIRVLLFKETGKLDRVEHLDTKEKCFETKAIITIVRDFYPNANDFVFEAYDENEKMYNCRLVKKDEVL